MLVTFTSCTTPSTGARKECRMIMAGLRLLRLQAEQAAGIVLQAMQQSLLIPGTDMSDGLLGRSHRRHGFPTQLCQQAGLLRAALPGRGGCFLDFRERREELLFQALDLRSTYGHVFTNT